MEVDWSADTALEDEPHQAVTQWELKDFGPLDGAAHIQVGMLADGGWYVRHIAFGTRRFEGEPDARQAARLLMDRHQGRWERTGCDSAPFSAVCRPDGSRVLYDMNDDACLYAYWGDQKDRLWESFSGAIAKGVTLRRTATHAAFDGYIELVGYHDPLDGRPRHAVVTAVDPGSDYRAVDYRDRASADDGYEESVYACADEDFPYRSSDMVDMVVDRRSKPPAFLRSLPDGTIVATDDLDEYDRLYGLPLRTRWPRTAELAVPPGAVCGMTAEPRDWGPAGVDLRDVTPVAWREPDGELRPNALALAALPDGRQLLASGHDGAAHVWSVGGTHVRTVSGHSEWVLSVALTVLSDGGVVLATGGKDGLARLWSAREGEALQEIEAHRGPVNAVAWACPPGEVPWLVTGGDDAAVRIWNAETGRSLGAFETGLPGLQLVWSVAAAVLADGHVCVAAAVSGTEVPTVHVWDATAGTTTHRFVIDEDGSPSSLPKVAVATLADRSFRVAAVAGPVVRVWDGHTGQVVRTLAVPRGGHGDVALAVLPDLRVVVAASGATQTLAWDVESGAELARLQHPEGGLPEVVALVTRPDSGLLLATGRQDDSPARIHRLDVRWQ